MTFNTKTLQTLVGGLAIVASLTLGSAQALAIAPEAAYPDKTIKLTVCNYKFNFTKYYENVVNLLNTNPYDKFDPAGGTTYCTVQESFTCANGAVVGGVPLLGVFNNTVNGVTYPAQGDITTGTDYCLNASIPDIFKTIAPSNNANLIPQIYNVTAKTGAAGETYYAPGFFDTGICQRYNDGKVAFKPEVQAMNDSTDPVDKANFLAALGTRNCNVTAKNREIYQFRYTIAYPTNEVCNTFYANLKPKVTQYYEADANGAQIRNLYKLVSGKSDSQFTPADVTGFYNFFKAYDTTKAAFGTTATQRDCPAFYKLAFGSKFGMTSDAGIVATSTYHSIVNEDKTAFIQWRKVESGRRLSETDPLKKAWDGYAAFNL